MVEMQKSAHLVYDFFEAVSNDDLSSAEQMLHPESELCTGKLKEYLSSIEQDLGICFSEDFSIKSDVTALSANPYIKRGYVTRASIFFNKRPYELSVLSLSNNNGFGLYSFTIYPYEE